MPSCSKLHADIIHSNHMIGLMSELGNVEKSRQRRSRQFAVLTYCEYAPRVKLAAALPVEKGVLAPLGLGG